MNLIKELRRYIARERAEEKFLSESYPWESDVLSSKERVFREIDKILLAFEQEEEKEVSEMADYYSQAQKRESHE